MTDLIAYPATRRWPPARPDAIQLYSLPTPNGVKVSIMLEETGLPYEAHRVEFGTEGTHSPEFLALNPNNKVPAILDPSGPGGQPLALFESGAILLYLADKSGRMIDPDEGRRWQTIQWLFWQMAGVGPMFGQLGFFNKFAGREYEDKRPRDRYAAEVRRLLGVLDHRLDGRDWVMDDYSIADIALIGWVNTLVTFYEAREISGFDGFGNVVRWFERALERPAVQRGLKIPAPAE